MFKALAVVKRCLALFAHDERKNLYFLTAIVAAMSLVELIGVVSILPFMSVVTNPESIISNKFLFNTYQYFNFQTETGFLLFLGGFALAALVIGNSVRALSSYMLVKFSQMQNHHLGTRILNNYLSQPYEYYLKTNSSDLIKIVLDEVSQFINSIVQPMLKGFARCCTAIFLIAMLVFVNPKVAIIMGLVLGTCYLVLYQLLKKRISSLGKQRVQFNRQRYRIISEVSGGIKEVKLMNHEETYLSEFDNPSEGYAITQSYNSLIGELPKYALEVVAFGGILSTVMYLIATQGQAQAISLTALYAFAGYKLMPALQEIFSSVNKVKFSLPVLKLVEESLHANEQIIKSTFTEDAKLAFTKGLELKNVYFQYANTDSQTLKNINLEIKANSTVGIKGPTGSGKTTLIDIILGLLIPSQGKILIDGVEISSENLRAWQQQIGYVPQSIYLLDNTIAANIAFGIPEKERNLEKIKMAANLAQISTFIETELPKSYQTQVGERGVRLSGGQRQRIGIARALYHDPSLLVFDEATSALDHETEKAVMESIEKLAGKKTILMIAHRLSTLAGVDQVVELNNGELTYSKKEEAGETYA